MEIRLTKGTKEIVPVDVVDGSGATTDLAGATPKYDVLNAADGLVYNAATPTASLMRLSCMIDTTATGPTGLAWAAGAYRLFVKFTAGSEIVRLGPVYIYLNEL